MLHCSRIALLPARRRSVSHVGNPRRQSCPRLLRAALGLLLLLAVFATGAGTTTCQAQLGGGFGGIGGGVGGGGGLGGGLGGVGGGLGGGLGGGVGGIWIDPNGVINPVVSKVSPKVERARREALAREYLSEDVTLASPLRKVSLVRLEAECARLAREGESIPEDMLYLAGLQRIDYLFVFPEERDIVLAGPAEGFAPDSTGRVVGLTTGRPALRLDDLLALVRSRRARNGLGCSIDPDTQRLAALRQYVLENSSATSTAAIRRRFDRMREILGMQNVSIFGIPEDSHLARALVEADYRLKLISLGLERPKVPGLRSHLDLLTPTGNSMQRWWFAPLYESFTTNEDRTAFQLVGQRVQVLSQEESVDSSGRRTPSAFSRVSTERFAQQLTEKFPKLAEVSPVFAELQNIVDLAIVTALLEHEQLAARAEWPMEAFLDAELLPLSRYEVPRQVATVVNYRRAGRGPVLGLLAGGVSIEPSRTLRDVEMKIDEELALPARRAIAAEGEANARWWWD